ncbi:MAG: hypothetical protein ACO4AU_04465 [bacterium]
MSDEQPPQTPKLTPIEETQPRRVRRKEESTSEGREAPHKPVDRTEWPRKRSERGRRKGKAEDLASEGELYNRERPRSFQDRWEDRSREFERPERKRPDSRHRDSSRRRNDRDRGEAPAEGRRGPRSFKDRLEQKDRRRPPGRDRPDRERPERPPRSSERERPPRRSERSGTAATERKPPKSDGEPAPRRKEKTTELDFERLRIPGNTARPTLPTAPARKGKRRAASQKSVKEKGRGKDADILLEALRVPNRGAALREWTHGFHTYPGRFHPHLPRTLLRAHDPQREPVVMDPFMGGGTVLVEAMVQGFEACGNDLNPVALVVARERTRWMSRKNSERVWGALDAVRKHVDEHLQEKRPIQRPYLDLVKPHHPPHLFVEMLHWVDAIDRLPESAERETLQAVFSSLIIKFSYRKADTSLETKEVPYAPGSVGRWMRAKTQELLQAQQALGEALPRKTRPRLLQENVRELESVESNSVHCLITSPPYPGTYDYFLHHELRMWWLKLTTSLMKQGELGAKRNFTPKQWKQAFRETLTTLHHKTVPEGTCYMVLGDWIDRGQRVSGLEFLRQYGPSTGWEVESGASVKRELFDAELEEAFGEAGRWEHLIKLRNRKGRTGSE